MFAVVLGIWLLFWFGSELVENVRISVGSTLNCELGHDVV